MTRTSSRFPRQMAPCGRLAEGERFDIEDDQGLVTDTWTYDCGCQRTRQEYHDGSMYVQVVRHDGAVLLDDFTPEHGA